jgi:hypothetical protein
MKFKMVTLLLATVVLCLVAQTAKLSAQESLPQLPRQMKRMYLYGRLPDAQRRLAEIMSASATGTTIPLFSYSVMNASRDGLPYDGQMVGRSPFFNGHRQTIIRTFLIPVKFTFPNTDVYDPTANDGCTPAGTTVLSLQQGSPIFVNPGSDLIMNGVDVGDTQYVDAFQRANFWSNVGGTPYGTLLSSPTVTAVQSVAVPAGSALEATGNCRTLGAIDVAWWDPSLNGGTGQGEAGTILSQVAATNGIGPTDLPIFIFNSVVIYIVAGGAVQCCVLGYHNAFSNPVQTYSVTNFDTSGEFGGDIDTISHETAEWMDDPLGTNSTPAWGHIGQQMGCQNNLEVGDPLSGTLFTSITQGGFTYHPQELAFYSWFFGGPSIGAGGKFSDNETFQTDAGQVCS